MNIEKPVNGIVLQTDSHIVFDYGAEKASFMPSGRAILSTGTVKFANFSFPRKEAVITIIVEGAPLEKSLWFHDIAVAAAVEKWILEHLAVADD